MSALKARFGVMAAGLCCVLAVYSVAQQTETQRETSGRAESSQFDRADSQQSGQSATQQSRRNGQQLGQSERGQTSQFNQRSTQARAGGQSQEVEHFLAACLMNKNQAEIELNQFAQQQAQNPEVKQFAQQMIKDHHQLGQQLQQVAGGQAGAANRTDTQSFEATSQRDTERQASDSTRLPGSSGAGQTARGSAAVTDSQGLNDTSSQGTRTSQSLTAERSTGGSGAIQQLMQIDRQIVKRQGQMVKEEMQQKQGPEFDKCYLGTVVHAHVNMLAALETIEQQGVGQLAQVAQQARPTVQQHLDHAKQLLEQQERASRAGGAQAERQPGTRTQ
jgi:predicted outer membrane protein